jgi:hypothetical protein
MSDFVPPTTGITYSYGTDSTTGRGWPLRLLAAEPFRVTERFGRTRIEPVSVKRRRRGSQAEGLVAVTVRGTKRRDDDKGVVEHVAATMSPADLGGMLRARSGSVPVRDRNSHHTFSFDVPVWEVAVPGVGDGRVTVALLLPIRTPLAETYDDMLTRVEACAAQEEAEQERRDAAEKAERARTDAVKQRLDAWARSRDLPLCSATWYSNGADVVQHVHRETLAALLDRAGAPALEPGADA